MRSAQAESMATLLDTVDKITQLTGLARGRIVHLDNVADLTERKTQPLAAQNEFQPDSVSR
jgi:hypothetical protein